MQKVLIAVIKCYQCTLSYLIGNQCRFYPTCSNYAVEAITIHGTLKGSWLAVKRISRCHPLNDGGLDPVPDSRGDPECKKDHFHSI